MRSGGFIAALLAAVCWLGVSADRALADGKIFQVAAAPAEIPGQSALIHFADGVETLAIETRFVGKGTDFAWVVPLPAKPEITPATAGLFPTLRATAVPELARPLNLLWAFPALILATWVFVGTKSRPVAGVLSLAIAIVGTGLLLPALGRARGVKSEPATEVRVLERRVVGSFEVATLEASGAAELRDWLKSNGFSLPPDCDAVLEGYVRDGWVFAACKLRRDGSTGATAATHPLVFRFKAASAVYPMRLTGAGAGTPLSLELYVFADRAARCNGLEVERCLPTVSEEHDSVLPRSRRAMPVFHSTLATLVGSAPIMTKLVGSLAPAQMDHDLKLEWADPRPVSDFAYSSGGAALVGSQTGLTIALAASLVAAVLAAVGRMADARAKQIAGLSLVVGVGVGVALYAYLPRTPVMNGYAIRQGESVVVDAAYDAGRACDTRGTPLFASFREAFDERMRVLRDLGRAPVPREEDSPGNYAVREMDGFACVFGYDGSGREVCWVSVKLGK